MHFERRLSAAGGGCSLAHGDQGLTRRQHVQIDNPGHSIQRIGRDCFEGAAEVHVERYGTTCEGDDVAGPCGVVENPARWLNLTDGLVHPIQRFTRTSEYANIGFWKARLFRRRCKSLFGCIYPHSMVLHQPELPASLRTLVLTSIWYAYVAPLSGDYRGQTAQQAPARSRK